jgi:hypothetical protein
VEIFVQEQEVIPNEEDGCNHEGEDSDGHSTTLDWETSAACCTNTVLGWANTETAAAFGLDWSWPWIFVILLLLLLSFVAGSLLWGFWFLGIGFGFAGSLLWDLSSITSLKEIVVLGELIRFLISSHIFL